MARFAVIGGASVATDLAVYALLVSWFDPAPAKAASYLSGMLVGFVGNKFWSFKSARRAASEPITYVLLYAVTLAVNVGVNGWVLALTGWRGPAFLVATGVTTVLNYLGLRWVTFRRGVTEREQDHPGLPPRATDDRPSGAKTIPPSSPRSGDRT